MSQHPRKVSFAGSLGGTLDARLDLPPGPPLAYALFAHCFTCSKDVVAATRIAAELTNHGIGVLRFDFTGLGSSEGDFSNTDFSSNLSDLRHAAQWLRDNARAPQLLIGHSLGGAAAIAVANSIPEVTAVVTIGAPADTQHVTQLFAPHTATIEREGCAVVELAGRSFSIRRGLLADLTSHSIEQRASELKAALLVMHSPIDNLVGIENAARLYGAAKHPKSFVSLDGADHLLTSRADAEFAAMMIATWSRRYITDQRQAHPAPLATAPVVVAETGLGTFLNHVVAGEHRFLADEPVSVGGYDAGPAPYDLLAAALGACTSMTLRLYADRKGLDLNRVAVEVEHGKVHADDCAGCVEGNGPLVDHFKRTITLDGNLDEAQRDSLLRIADRCPVHRTLESTVHITTALA